MVDEELQYTGQTEEWFCGKCGSYYGLPYGTLEYECPKCGTLLKR